MKEKDRIKELKRRNRELEKALADSKVREVLNQAYFEMVCEKFGITDLEGFKKKADAKLFDEERALADSLPLQKALGQLPEGKEPIHHSDRGIQYCCQDYTEMLESHGVTISMTEDNLDQ